MSNPLLIELRERCEAQMVLSVCNGCSECFIKCSAGVPATREEWETLQNHIAELSDEARDALKRVLAQPKEVDLGDGFTATLCRFLERDSKRCMVYSARPLVCRLMGHVEWLPCPIEKVPHVVATPNALALMQEYAKEERKTLEEWQQDSPFFE